MTASSSDSLVRLQPVVNEYDWGETMETIPILVSEQEENREVKGLFSLDSDVVLWEIPMEVEQIIVLFQ